jgi:hypothetical protein
MQSSMGIRNNDLPGGVMRAMSEKCEPQEKNHDEILSEMQNVW